MHDRIGGAGVSESGGKRDGRMPILGERRR
jgi:hypothetical protein